MYKQLNSLSFLALTLSAITLVSCSTGQTSEQQIKKTTQVRDVPAWELGEIEQTYKVSSVADSGAGTLREAIQLANASPGTDKIVFHSDEDLYSQPQTIFIETPLPTISDNLLIDGYIENMLWKASGVTIDARQQHRLFNQAANTKVKLKHLSIENGKEINGGAIYTEGELVIEGCTLSNNHADNDGGAIHANGIQTIIINSTFYENTANRYGGAVANINGLMKSTHNTFTNNTSERGGAIYNYDQLAIANSILANSTAQEDCYSDGIVTSNHKSIIETEAGCGIAYSSEDPLLKSPNLYNGPIRTIPLGARSPAVNYGDNDYAVNEYGDQLKWDQRGNGDPRNAAGVADIGAFETQANNRIEVDTAADVDYRWCVVFKNDCSLRGAMLLASLDKRFPTITFRTEVFVGPSELALPQPLPEITMPLLLTASPGLDITLTGPKSVIEQIKINPLITLENIQLKAD